MTRSPCLRILESVAGPSVSCCFPGAGGLNSLCRRLFMAVTPTQPFLMGASTCVRPAQISSVGCWVPAMLGRQQHSASFIGWPLLDTADMHSGESVQAVLVCVNVHFIGWRRPIMNGTS